MALADGKAAFKAKLESGKTSWVDGMIQVENTYLAEYDQPALTNDPDSNLDRVSARYEAAFDNWIAFMDGFMFDAIIELIGNNAEVTPDTLNVAGLAVVAGAISPPALLSGKGKVA